MPSIFGGHFFTVTISNKNRAASVRGIDTTTINQRDHPKKYARTREDELKIPHARGYSTVFSA